MTNVLLPFATLLSEIWGYWGIFYQETNSRSRQILSLLSMSKLKNRYYRDLIVFSFLWITVLLPFQISRQIIVSCTLLSKPSFTAAKLLNNHPDNVSDGSSSYLLSLYISVKQEKTGNPHLDYSQKAEFIHWKDNAVFS